MRAVLTRKGDRFEVSMPYSPIAVERLGQVPGRAWVKDKKVWTFPAVRDALYMVCDIAGLLPDMLGSDFADLTGNVAPPAPPDLSVLDGHVWLVPPFEHQKADLARLILHPRWLLAAEMGCGKSMVVVNRLWHLYSTEKVPQNVLILCPKSVMSGWKRELYTHGRFESVAVEGDAGRREQIITDPHAIKVANYELLLYSDFTRQRYDVVVLDEIHRVKNLTAQTGRIVQALAAKARYVWGLSGTPAPNGLEDWCGVLAALDPAGVPWKTKKDFEQRHILKRRLDTGAWIVGGYRNVADLHAIVQRYVSRVTKAQCLDLPGKLFMRRSVRLVGRQAEIYRALRKDAVARLDDLKKGGVLTVNNVLSESLRLLQVAGGFVPDDDGTLHELQQKAKMEALFDILEEAGDRQAVIWTAFRAEADFIARWLPERLPGSSAVTLTGDTPAAQRARNVEVFRRGDARYFVGTAAAGGTGVDGLQAASLEVFYSRTYTLTDYLQAQDRCIAEGQPVLTPGGWKPIESIEIGDLVYGGNGNACAVTAISRRQSLEMMAELVIEGWPDPIVCTADHRFLCSAGHYVNAENLRPGDRLLIPPFAAGESDSIVVDDSCHVAPTFVNNRGAEQTKGSLIHMPVTVTLDADFLFTLGFAAGNGYAVNSKGKGAFVGFSAHKKKMPYLLLIKAWWEKQGVNCSVYPDAEGCGNNVEMRAFSIEWANAFATWIGQGAHDKRLPSWALTLSHAQTHCLWDGLRKSDGYYRRGRWEYCTVSRTLAAHVLILMRKLGYRPCVTNGSTGQILVAYSESSYGETSPLVREVKLRFPKRKSGRREMVYDLTVPGADSFVIGMIVAHNCHRIGQANAVTVVNLLAENTVDEKVDDALERKADLQNLILGRAEDML